MQFFKNVAIYLIILNLIAKFATISKMYFFDPRSVTLKPIRIRSPFENTQKGCPSNPVILKKKGKHIYQVMNPQKQTGTTKTSPEKNSGNNVQTKTEIFDMTGINLLIALVSCGYLKPRKFFPNEPSSFTNSI